MNRVPYVSIIIPAYNMAPWINETLYSVLQQTFEDWECLIIDDGSTDNTVTEANALADPRIKIFSQTNKGVSAARNCGLELAQGQYIAFLDADDIWAPRALELMCAALDACPECVLAWADFVRFEDGTGRELPLPSTRLWHTGNTWTDMLVDNFLQFGAICVRGSSAKKLRFDTSLRIGEDRDWLLRLLRNGRGIHVPHVVHFYRQRMGSAVRDVRRFLADEEAMMGRYLEDPLVPSKVRRRALSALAFHRAVLLAKLPGNWFQALASYLRAIIIDPFYIENYIRPLFKLYLLFCRRRKVDIT